MQILLLSLLLHCIESNMTAMLIYIYLSVYSSKYIHMYVYIYIYIYIYNIYIYIYIYIYIPVQKAVTQMFNKQEAFTEKALISISTKRSDIDPVLANL